ncbi:MAG: hypothetical protein KJ726_00910 [Verrucomicrobia bacterium]|nr:hypothetical protein [Verrucomicrobiota bacterium]MBU1908590.1 hypothetical protein [Verrucomicrobiota bacterium]
MNRKLTCILLLAVLVTTTIALAAEPQSWPLVVRGGDLAMHFRYNSANKEPYIAIKFGKASAGVGQQGERASQVLGPGQAAWLDRPIAPNEPHQLVLQSKWINDFWIYWKNSVMDAVVSNIKSLDKLQSPDEFEWFYVYNDGTGNFIVTHIGRK